MEGATSQGRQQPPEAGKGKQTESPPDPPGKHTAPLARDFSSVKPPSDFRPPELDGNKCVSF